MIIKREIQNLKELKWSISVGREVLNQGVLHEQEDSSLMRDFGASITKDIGVYLQSKQYKHGAATKGRQQALTKGNNTVSDLLSLL